MPDHDGYGALAAALAKAQAAFPAISRDKEVTVQTKAGGSYKFKYAPLDAILAAVRAPLAANGLAIVQLLDEDMLVTSLLHESGAILSGRTPIPQTEGVQAYGSAITYLRRYAIQALLGVAAEEDDDGNRAAGNDATTRTRGESRSTVRQTASTAEAAERYDTGTEWATRGTASAGGAPYDGELRETPEGGVFGFRVTPPEGKGYAVLAEGDMALPVSLVWGSLIGQEVHVVGPAELVPWDKKVDGVTKKMPPYRLLHARRIESGEVIIPAPPDGPLQEAEDAADEAYHDAVDAELDAIADALP